MKLDYQVKKDDAYQTIRQILREEFLLSYRLILKLKHQEKILLNGKSVYIDHAIIEGDTVAIIIDFEEESENIVPTKMDLSIVHEDEYYLVIDKPAGIPIHPSMSHYEDTLSNGLKYYFNQIGLCKKIRPVNRLDKDTSGIVIFAKNEYIQECMIKQMKQNQFQKEYIAICEGIFENTSGTIDAPIARKENSIIERCIKENGDPSITHYAILKQTKEYAVIKCLLETRKNSSNSRSHSFY